MATNLRDMVPGWDRAVEEIHRQGSTRLQRYVQQESVSFGNARPIPDNIWKMVRLVENDLGSFVSVEVHETQGYPVVTATIRASKDPDNAPTLLLYNMGDTRPIGDPKEWLADPLACETAEVEGQRRIFGRGIFNSKSGLAGMIDVVELLHRQGNLPVNLEVIIDFEEEVRTDAVREVLTKYNDRYAKCSAAFMPLCTEKYRSIWLAFKGVCVARVTLKQYRSQVHSGMESILRSPNLRHALDMFLTFFDKRSRKHPFPIDSLVGEVTYKDRELANQLATSMNLQQFADLWGVAVKELCSTNVVDCVLDELRSHVNILSWGSEHCEGVVPTRAYAELEFRISPSVQLTASEIEEEVRRYVQSLEPYLTEGVLLDSIEFVAGTGEPFRAADPEGPLVKTLQRSYQSFGENIPLVPALFASIPEGATIRRALGIPFLTGGLGVGHGAHVPNEYILEGAYERFKEWLVVFFHQVAR